MAKTTSFSTTGTSIPDKATKGDILYSMQRNVADTLARAVFHSAFRADIKNIFFMGNFVKSSKIQEWMTEMLHYQNLRIEPDQRIKFRFVKNGGYLAAIGGYLQAKSQ